MKISATAVKELRDLTNAGMMDCKNALLESDGNLEKAKIILNEKGKSSADSKSGRTTTQGLVWIQAGQELNLNHAVILEVNCETDFAAKDDLFKEFVHKIAKLILKESINDMDQLNEQSIDDFKNVEGYRKFVISKLGENITIRRFEIFPVTGILGSYIHGSKIAALVLLDSIDPGHSHLAKDLAMHVAASKPKYLNSSDIPKEIVKEETRILTLQAEEEGKPKEIIEKIVKGKLAKQMSELTLLDQEFIKDSDLNVSQLLKKSNTNVLLFVRYEVGDGIQREVKNFAEEVKAQVDASQ